MSPSFPEHRTYSVLSALQAGIILIGSIFVRVATGENFQGYYQPPPALAMWARDWGFLFLLVPVAWLVWSIRASRRDEMGERAGLRIAAGVILTVLLGVFFWWLLDRSMMRYRFIMEA